MKKPAQTSKPLGLYIHIPFCRSKCAYCDFYSLPAASPAAQNRYTAALRRHLAESAALMTSYEADTVYFGGGTPSLLGARRLKGLMKTIRGAFRLSPEAEVTLEANPDSMGDLRLARSLRRTGFNRISLGVQSADDGELGAIGRVHSFQQAAEAVQAVRAGGFENVSLDLIYGLPGQTLASWQRTVDRCAALEPEHFSCYGLKVEEGTPLWDRQEGLPDGDLQADMYLWMVERLAQLGYAQYEISNFARPGRASRHNLKYWTLAEYAGFGPGAHSDLGGVRYAFVRDLDAYCQCVESGGDILAESERITPWERELEYLMLGLRTVGGISRQEFESRCRMNFSPLQDCLERFARTGHAREEGGRWHLTPEGFLVSNQIIGQMLDVLAEMRRNRQSAGRPAPFKTESQPR